jgi:hypothetical protein
LLRSTGFFKFREISGCPDWAHPSSSVSEDEYDFFMNGHVADYWFRFITRENDYNLYLKGFAKSY